MKFRDDLVVEWRGCDAGCLGGFGGWKWRGLKGAGCSGWDEMKEEEGGVDFNGRREFWVASALDCSLSLGRQKAKEGGDCWGFYQLLKDDACWILKIHRREQLLATAKDDGGNAQSMPPEILLRHERGRAELEVR